MTSLNVKFVIDTHAWIEYFTGSERGNKVRHYVESGFAITPMLAIAELSDKYARENWQTLAEDLDHIQETSEIVPLGISIALAAGFIKKEARVAEKNFSLADAIMLATARSLDAKLVTGAREFSSVKEAIMI